MKDEFGLIEFRIFKKLKVMKRVDEIKLENRVKNAVKRIIGENRYNHEPTIEDFLVITRHQFKDQFPDMERHENILMFGYQAAFN